jgi:hypothetical protein
MEGVTREIDGGHLRVRDLDAFGIFIFVELGAYFEAGIGCGRGDQLDDRAIASQRLATPIDRDEREQAMLDLVAFAGAGWPSAGIGVRSHWCMVTAIAWKMPERMAASTCGLRNAAA